MTTASLDPLRALRASAQRADAAGAVVSVGLMVVAGLRVGAPRVLMVLFPMWVLAPFAAFAIGCACSSGWGRAVRVVLYADVIASAVGSAVVYAFFALRASRPPTAVFVLVPPATVLFAALALAVTAVIARRSA